MISSICFAVFLIWLQRKRVFATDTLLGILAHAALAIGVITITLLEQRIDLHGYLFGDILTVGDEQLWWLGYRRRICNNCTGLELVLPGFNDDP